MILFVIGLGLGVALGVALLVALLYLDGQLWPECARCSLALPRGYTEKLCPLCQQKQKHHERSAH